MRLFSEKTPDLQSLYIKQLRLLRSAEEMIAIKTPFLVDSSTDSELHEALREQVIGNEDDMARLREILGRISRESDPIKCRVVYALFEEAEEIIEDAAHNAVRDAVVIAEVQRIKHYEMAALGAVRQFARVLGRSEDVAMLDQSIQEKNRADRRLTGIAERINPSALAAA